MRRTAKSLRFHTAVARRIFPCPILKSKLIRARNPLKSLTPTGRPSSDASEVDGQALLFPVPIADGFGPLAAAEFDRPDHLPGRPPPLFGLGQGPLGRRGQVGIGGRGLVGHGFLPSGAEEGYTPPGPWGKVTGWQARQRHGARPWP